MVIEHCREFLVLARMLNFTEAAAELNMTQPALTKHVQALEKELGVELFKRGRKGIRLTDAGNLFVDHAHALVGRYDDMMESMRSFASNSLRVDGHLNDADISSFVSMVALIAREERKTYVTFDNERERDFAERLLHGEIDLFIGYLDPQEALDAGLELEVFTDDSLVAIMDSRHRLASRPFVTLEDLEDETLLHCSGDVTDPAWGQIKTALEERGVRPRLRSVQCDNPIACFTTPLSGSILLWKHTFREIGQLTMVESRVSVPVEDDIRLTTYLAYLPEAKPRLEGFLDSVEEARGLLEKRRRSSREKEADFDRD